jgi:hypothetical protein
MLRLYSNDARLFYTCLITAVSLSFFVYCDSGVLPYFNTDIGHKL